MPTINTMTRKAINAEIVRLSEKSLQIVDSDQLSFSQKKAQLAPIEREIKTYQDEVAERDFVEKKAKQFAGVGGTVRETTGGIFKLYEAPTMNLSPEESRRIFKAAQDRTEIVVKTIDTDDLPQSQVPGQNVAPVLAAREPVRILELIPSRATDRAVERYYITTGTSGAAPTAEGADKPESGMSFTSADAGMTKIAHWSMVTEEALEDYGPFASFLQSDMIGGLIDAENRELLYGTGTGDASKFKGLLKVTGTQSYVRKAQDNMLDALEIGGNQLRIGGRFTDPDGYVMHPTDFSKIRRLKDTQGNYILGHPSEAGPKTIWGRPVVLTTEIAEGKAVVANLAVAAEAYIRKVPEYRTNANGVGFRSNKVEVIAEERIGLAVKAPAAVCVVTLSDPA